MIAPVRLAVVTCVLVLALYVRVLWQPQLSQDDFGILRASWTAERTWVHLWIPNNEHVMPLGRLLTFGLVKLAGTMSAVPRVVDLVGPVALLFGLGLVYRFVRRETGHPLFGLIALILFGISSVYYQAVSWFAASFSVLALDTILLALLAAQRWRQTGQALSLDLMVLASALAPAWFASGILAGPLCCLYLLPVRGTPGRSFTLLPLLGTGLFLALSLPRSADTVMHLHHYGEHTALDAFQPRIGLLYTCRSIVDNLLLGMLGISLVAVPLPLVVLVLIGLAGVGVWWWRQAPHRSLVLLGAGLIGSSYLLTYSARALWEYDGTMTSASWGRYHLLPQLGLALFVCGGLPGPGSKRFALDASGQLTPLQARGLKYLMVILFLVQLPRALIVYQLYDPEQAAMLRRIEAMDERCRREGVSADAARKALPFLSLERWASDVNGWDFLRGSLQPRTLTPDEARALLKE